MSEVSEKVLKQREYKRIWTAKNADKERERQRKVKEHKRSSDREAYNAYMREWRDRNKEQINAARRERRKNDLEYAAHVRAKDRARPKDQVKNKRIRNDYGITLEEFNAMRERQNYCCAICGVHEDEAGVKKLAIDHCHNEGHVRGLLCSHCNIGLGQFRDSKEFLLKAVEYLERMNYGYCDPKQTATSRAVQ